MSHRSTAKELKELCEIGGDCAEWNEYLAKEEVYYEQSAQLTTLSIWGIGLAVILLAIAIFSIPKSKKIKTVLFWVFNAVFVLAIPMIVSVVALSAGFAISFSACFKSSCSGFEESAIYIVPLLSLLVSIPALLFTKRKFLPKFKNLLNNRSERFWHMAGAILIVITLITAGTATYWVQVDKISRIEYIRNP